MMMSASERVDEALRVAGRLVALALATAVLFFIVGVALKPLLPDGLPPGPDGRLIYLSLLLVSIAVSQVLMVALTEQSDWTLTGLGSDGWSPWAILGGLGIGSVVPVLATLVGMLVRTPHAPLSWVWPTSSVLIAALVASLMDALLFRGYTIGLLASACGDVIAVASTAGLSALLTLFGDAPTPGQAIDAFMLASCLGILRLRTGSLAAAWLAAFATVVLRDSLGPAPIPFVTAGMLALVSFLVFRLPARTLTSTPQ